MRVFISIVAAACVVAIAVLFFALRTPTSPFDTMAALAAPTSREKGEYIARLGDCVACHTTEGGAPFAGGLSMGTPIGTIFSSNITPDAQTGIGNWTLAEFDRAVRHGVSRDGHRLYPAMPYPSYAKLTDDDVASLYDYFKNRVQPVRQETRASTMTWPLNMRWPPALWNLVFTDKGTYTGKAGQDEQWNRGAYLVQGAGHCGSCHTPRALTMQERGLDERSNLYLAGAVLDGWFAPSLRSDPNTGLGRWSEGDIVAYLKEGRNEHSVVFGSMMEAFNNSTQYMSDADLQSIAHYLKSLPGDQARDRTPWQYAAARNVSPASAAGSQIFDQRCATCHGSDGQGRGRWIPPLAGVSSLLASDPSSAINVTLNGGGRVIADGTPDSYRMPQMRTTLSDREIADVLIFIRSSWGNSAAGVSQEDVKKLRDHTNAASADPIILQMR